MRLAAQITGFFRCMSMSVFAIQNFKIRGKTLPTYWNRTFLLLACQTQEKGDNLLDLEAMKMENIIKAPADVVVKSIKIKPGDKVEKNQILMLF